MEITTRNTNTLMHSVYQIFRQQMATTPPTESRNGPVYRYPEPVSICLTHPDERVNFSAVRDANPFFHLMEGLAMLAPHNSVAFLAYFAKAMLQYSDDGQTYNAFYGTRARRWTHTPKQLIDQLSIVIRTLRDNPDTRQAVVQLWDPIDLVFNSKDKACNLALLFDISREGLVNMTSFNRSNDAVLGGVSGANIVHLSMFQEYVACALGRPVGVWWHISNNLHVYAEQPQWKRLCEPANVTDIVDPYTNHDHMELLPLFDEASGHSRNKFDEELSRFLNHATAVIVGGFANDLLLRTNYADGYISAVAVPMFNVWQRYKAKDNLGALMLTEEIVAPDWKLACRLWLDRRINSHTKPIHNHE